MSDQSGLLQPFLGNVLPWLYRDSIAWTVFGLVGNALFSSRFLLQWLHSEKQKQLVVPPIFWHLSFWGSVISLIYALHIDKLPVAVEAAIEIFQVLHAGVNVLLGIVEVLRPHPPPGARHQLHQARGAHLRTSLGLEP